MMFRTLYARGMRLVCAWVVAMTLTACGDNVASDCKRDEDCGAPVCATAICKAGRCEVTPFAENTPAAVQIEHDCRIAVCDGSGGVMQTADDGDLPAKPSECFSATCTAGEALVEPLQAGTACGTGSGMYCDNVGQCVGCLGAVQCPGTDTECHSRTCINETCGATETAAGTVLVSGQVKGDCHVEQCDGNGGVQTVIDNNDVPTTTNLCVTEACNAGVPMATNKPAGTACGTGHICDGSGGCGECNVASDCPGSDTECSFRTCTNHFCGTGFAPANTPKSQQTPGDCLQNVCDGNGGSTTIHDDIDTPSSTQCSDGTCVAGVPAMVPKNVGVACSTGVCDGNGSCVACVQPSDCSGTDTDCEMRTCLSNTCGTMFEPTGTPTSQQTPGDCQQMVCDGSGGTTSFADNTDHPPASNECTDGVCMAGIPAEVPKPVGTPCTGGTCDGAGNCVP